MTERTLDDLSIQELELRHFILANIIQLARAAGDGRWKEAARQQRCVNDVLVKKIKERDGEKPPVIIEMQPATMKHRALAKG